MTTKRKAVFPSKAGRPGKTASKTIVNQNTPKTSWRQRLQRLAVWLPVVGVHPICLVEWLLRRGGGQP